MVVDKGSVTPPPSSSKEEHIQKESSEQEQLEPRAIEEASKEAQVVKYVQQPSQDVEDQTTGSIETNTIEKESLQYETLSKCDKGKEVVKHTPSSSRAKVVEKHIPRWYWKEIMRSNKHQFHASEDDICDIVEILNKLDSPLHDAMPFMFVTTI